MCLDEDLLVDFYDEVIENFMNLITHVSGLGVVKRVIMHCTNAKINEFITGILVKNALMLVQNAYGNYAVQIGLEVFYK
jgi:pumilio RNA-binding family